MEHIYRLEDLTPYESIPTSWKRRDSVVAQPSIDPTTLWWKTSSNDISGCVLDYGLFAVRQLEYSNSRTDEEEGNLAAFGNYCVDG
jgi:hypothetical protein